MKKPYQKPALYAENFALCDHIAGACTNNNGYVISFQGDDFDSKCTLYVPDQNYHLFGANNAVCNAAGNEAFDTEFISLEDFTNNLFCYAINTNVIVTS